MADVQLIDTGQIIGVGTTIALVGVKKGDIGIVTCNYPGDMGNPAMTFNGVACSVTHLVDTDKNGPEVEYHDIWWFEFPSSGNANFAIATSSSDRAVTISVWRNLDPLTLVFNSSYQAEGAGFKSNGATATPNKGGLFWCFSWGSDYTPTTSGTSIQTATTPRGGYVRNSYKVGDGSQLTITSTVTSNAIEQDTLRANARVAGGGQVWY